MSSGTLLTVSVYTVKIQFSIEIIHNSPNKLIRKISMNVYAGYDFMCQACMRYAGYRLQGVLRSAKYVFVPCMEKNQRDLLSRITIM